MYLLYEKKVQPPLLTVYLLSDEKYAQPLFLNASVIRVQQFLPVVFPSAPLPACLPALDPSNTPPSQPFLHQ